MIADISSPQKCFEKAEQLKKREKKIICMFIFRYKRVPNKENR